MNELEELKNTLIRQKLSMLESYEMREASFWIMFNGILRVIMSVAVIAFVNYAKHVRPDNVATWFLALIWVIFLAEGIKGAYDAVAFGIHRKKFAKHIKNMRGIIAITQLLIEEDEEKLKGGKLDE
ncbi:hypothetical protein kochi14H1_1020 [Enterococcus phage phi EF14H1]|uniref:Uncharacterized protein n=6 Tax=Kochikohdavirus TaxID=2560160 RepID=A0A4D6DVF2_9CAUD|nr:hypothetical protein [Enterococcus phage ECP3]QBZ69774.1 hypothetical protein [Enterococcus phage vB_EfaM_Ef2.1]QBZ70188.1 hypothetical protein [Enterococcus phage vB_EfaM_Ef2.3]QPW37281.1 hypothetical protein [Enterococcus phage PBEF129]BBE37171.1 hypothetical protein PHIEF17H_1020 [Enterococcus phage phiEF17H]BBE37374.1 hypothetical protein PHIM1EF22_1010 [Enterococcus phage phiM1EF22]BCN33173.1 hypothetical protein kochiEF7H_1020 [Enterococcus phage phi EF7H]BCN33377.1 hypothetical pro